MPPKGAVKSNKSVEIEFLNWELSPEEKTAAKAYEIDSNSVFEALERLIDDGYRVSFKRDDFNKCFNVSLTEPADNGRKVCRCIVSRGPTVLNAARIACFKHFELLEGDWGKISAVAIERDVWG